MFFSRRPQQVAAVSPEIIRMHNRGSVLNRGTMSSNNEWPRVMFICSVSPFPKTVGKTLMIGGICEFLMDSECISALKLLCFEPLSLGYGITAELLPRPGLFAKAANVLLYSILLRAKALQESFYWSRRSQERIVACIEEFKPDVVIYDTVRTGQYLYRKTGQHTRHILYMDDLFSVRYERILAASRRNPLVSRDALGNFASKLPKPLMFLYDHFSWLRKVLLKAETRLISATEMRCPSQFERCLLISEAEAKILRGRTRAANIEELPPRIERSISPLRRTWKGRPDFVFIGSLNLSHNAFGIEHFLENGFASILSFIPGLKLSIVGRGASSNLVRLANRFPDHVELMGFVDDVDAVLSRSCAMLCPLFFGSGIKIKTIDALRCGIPLISTSFGVEGVHVQGIHGVRVVESTGDFAAAMLDLLDPARNSVASQSNREAFQRMYGKGVVDEAYKKAFLDAKA